MCAQRYAFYLKQMQTLAKKITNDGNNCESQETTYTSDTSYT